MLAPHEQEVIARLFDQASLSGIRSKALTVLLSQPVPPGCSLLAVGSLARSEIAPGSDVDLMLVHEPDRRDEAEQAFTRLLHQLWDRNERVGHTLRTIDEIVEEGRGSLEALTKMLEAELLSGSRELFDQAREAAIGLVDADRRGFVEQLMEWRVEREARFGSLGSRQEPDLKESLGGVRDLALRRWIGHAMPHVGSRIERVSNATGDPVSSLSVHAGVLRGARQGLHATGTASNVLSFEAQVQTSADLGLEAVPGWDAPDRLMKAILHAGRWVDALARLALDEVAETIWRRPSSAFVSPHTPLDFMGPFVDLAESGARIPAGRLETLAESYRGATWQGLGDGALDGLVRILSSGDGARRALELFDLLGFLSELIPEWDLVRGRVQRDPYHRHPVDSHLVETAAVAATLLHRPDEPFAAAAVAQVADPTALLFGALLHDIGKVGRGSHVPAGAEIAGRVLDRLGVQTEVRHLVLFLVAEHLLLSDTATRRDLEDGRLIADVADRIGTPERLAMLYLLTVADALSTGPAASTPWRMGLVRDLVSKVSAILEGGSPVAWRVDSVPSGSLELASPRLGETEVRTRVRAGRAPGTFALTVCALDRPGLLSRIAGALTLSGLSILSAQALTTDDGIAVDTFEVGPAFDEEIEEERWRRFRTILRHAIEGRIDVRDRIERMREHYRPARADIPVSVRIDQGASSSFTVVEVGAADRLGLLFDLARAFSVHGLDVHLAKVATYGPRVVDVFYVTDATGSKVTEPQLAAELERGLTEAVRPR